MNEPLLQLQSVSKAFGSNRLLNQHLVKAVDGVTLTVIAKETVALVGESGSGKSTVARLALGLMKPTAGRISFAGTAYEHLNRAGWRRLRREMQPVFQDPASSLNPRQKVLQIVRAPLDVFKAGSKIARNDAVAAELARVGLNETYLPRFPHQLSGGERQRVAIARALILRPKLVVADEPTSALDVSVQAELLRLLIDRQSELGMAYLFISHNLAVVKHVADWVAVMYLGRIVEFGRREEIFSSPQHPYTRALLDSVPIVDPKRRYERIDLVGELPQSGEIPSGCRFRDRCPHSFDLCAQVDPDSFQTSTTRLVACHLAAPSALETAEAASR